MNLLDGLIGLLCSVSYAPGYLISRFMLWLGVNFIRVARVAAMLSDILMIGGIKSVNSGKIRSKLIKKLLTKEKLRKILGIQLVTAGQKQKTKEEEEKNGI